MRPTTTHLIILLVVVLLLFGANRLPGAARSLGRSLRIFKSEVKELGNDDDDPDDERGARQFPDRPGRASTDRGSADFSGRTSADQPRREPVDGSLGDDLDPGGRAGSRNVAGRGEHGRDG